MPTHAACSLAMLGLLCAARLGAQQAEDWALQFPWPTGANDPAAMAHDPLTGRPVRFGGMHTAMGYCPDLWEWNVDRWQRRASSPCPPLRAGHAMVTDTVRHQIVLFGGASSLARDTWTWDGTRWHAHATPLLLAMRTGHAMAFDAQRGRVVLFGGVINPLALFGDTWEWDGANWSLCQPGAPPQARHGHQMAFDAARGRVVLFGGSTTATYVTGDTWEWDGTFWTQRFPTVQPAARTRHALAYDGPRQRVVMFGGFAGGSGATLDDTWEWNGANWSRAQPAHSPPAHPGNALLHDAAQNRLVMFGATSGIDDVWQYDGVDWQQVVRPPSPSARADAALVHDITRGESILFGGIVGIPNAADTWSWNGARWTALSPATSPSARHGSGSAFHLARGVVLLFGGSTSGSSPAPSDETWSWNGTTWSVELPAHRPPSRIYPGLAWHHGSQQIVLFGGTDGSNTSVFGDTWTWDGTDWTQQAPLASPPPRFLSALASDGQEVLLFGGSVFGTFPSQQSLADTWRWNGSGWIQLQPISSPPSRYQHAMATDIVRGRVLMTGGRTSSQVSQALADTWAWDGTNWTLLGTSTTPTGRASAAMAYDAQRRSIVMFGGNGYGLQGDTWTLAPAGTESTFGAGCPGTLGVPALQTSPLSLPEPGGTVVVDLANLPATIAVMLAGFSNTTTGSQALPLALAPFGMPGCSLLVAPDAATLLVATAHAAQWSLVVPHAAALQGVEFFCQALALDLPANAAGLIATNAARCRLGN